MRRTKAQIEDLKSELVRLTELHKPVTVRQVFYLAVSAGLIDKTEKEYLAVARYLVQLRKENEIP